MTARVSLFAAALAAFLGCLSIPCFASRAFAAVPSPPGVVIAHSPAKSGLYIGSPSIVILTNNDYLASHDFFGPASREHEKATSILYRSKDTGTTWKRERSFEGSFWANLFVHRGAVYLMGTDRHHGRIVIRRSLDNGSTWTEPLDGTSGVLTPEAHYHTAPMPVLEHEGSLWRAFEDSSGGTKWGQRYMAGMLSIPAGADLLQAKNWVFSNFLKGDTNWLGRRFGGWLEGNAVLNRQGKMVNMLRVETPGCPESAAIVTLSADGKTVEFNPETGFVEMPGGAKKFSIRFDGKSGCYWTLATPVLKEYEGIGRPGGIRNALALMRSQDMRTWEIRSVLAHHPDTAKHGFQYPDWQFDGADIVAAVRTAFDDEDGGARNNHDANYLTFHRIADFRSRQGN